MKIGINPQFIATLPSRLVRFIRNIPWYISSSARTAIRFLTFFCVLLFFSLDRLFALFNRVPVLKVVLQKLQPIWNKSFKPLYIKAMDWLETLRPFKVKRNYLIYIAYQNLNVRRGRSVITILGMSIGVGIIVFLLSLGYGIEKLVISQVASLDELRIVDVTSGENSKASLTRDAVRKMKTIKDVENTIPMVSVVGRLDYKNAKTDILVYGVPAQFFQAAQPELVKGSYFAQTGDGLSEKAEGQVAGEQDELQRRTYNRPKNSYSVRFSPLPTQVVPVWKECNIDSELLGVTLRQESDLEGREWYGGEYAPLTPYGRLAYDQARKQYLGEWIKAEIPLYKQDQPEASVAAMLNNRGVQEWAQGCVQRKNVQITESLPIIEDVLGESTGSAELEEATNGGELDPLSADLADARVSTGAGGLETVFLQTDTTTETQQAVLPFKKKVSGDAVISTGLLNLLGVSTNQATKENFKVSFIIIKSLMPSVDGRILTEEVTYNIIGVVRDDESQFIYVPLDDITSLGTTNYSQVKLILKDENVMGAVRTRVETLGYKTASTADTVEQIESFFVNIRGVLGFLGFIALGVASLGMFNTLTVSLLERTREIGGMKTMGMVSGEIQELFLAEAMIMGLLGGSGGLLLGFVVGKLASYVVSIFAIAQGVGYLELTYIPSSLVFFIIICSFVVGLVTGLYPAYRAQRISALNALRYE
ncbi:MAG: ABC transporter permease [Weeksellaceae bacterium]